MGVKSLKGLVCMLQQRYQSERVEKWAYICHDVDWEECQKHIVLIQDLGV